jgi:hypothetical protein
VRNNIFCSVAIAACAMPGAAMALEWTWGALELQVNSRVTTGVAVRMEERSNDLLGKLNVPGQSHLCDVDSCISLSGDPEPNQRLVNAEGAFSGINTDNGNLNYDKYDIVTASNRLSVDTVASWDDWLARVRVIGFYDPVNARFDEYHTDTRFQPEYTRRTSKVAREYARGIDLYDAYISRAFEWFGHGAQISVGAQTVRWGESTLIARNSIAEINSPSSVILHTPGFEISEVFQPVPAIVLSTGLSDAASMELFYQLKWEAVQPDPDGSFFGDQDIIEGRYAAVTLGNHGEDPDQRQRVNGPISLISSTSLTVYPGDPHEPRDMGQYGARLNYLLPFNDGIEVGLYYLNYHARYPVASATASDESCTRRAAPSPTGGASNSIIACQGFNGSLLGRQNEHNPEREPLPVDTFGVYLEYPEDVRMFGISFNTTIGEFSVAAEYSYRPNLPLQVHINDLIFAALQPAFPENRTDVMPVDTDLLAQLAATVGLFQDLAELGRSSFPSYEDAVPSYLPAYRGYGMVQPNQVIPGYERQRVGQFDLTAIKAFSNLLWADQILAIGEVGFTHVYDMPDRSVLQFEGNSPNRTHASEGQDENVSAPGERNYAHLNPTRQRDGFADPFAWGVRAIIRGEYNDVVFGWNMRPQVIAQWDIGGIAPMPLQNFVEGRKQFDIGTDILFTDALAARVNYQIYTGGGRHNTYADSDNLAVSVTYAF